MQIQLNGEPHALAQTSTITELLESIGLSGKPVVVELNCEPVLPRNFPTTDLEDGNQVEIVTLAAGG